MGILLFISVLLVAACGLIYELVAGTLASYLVGDSVFQFSTIIGTYLFAMGIGSALSRYLNRGLVYRFVWIELLLGGYCAASLMYYLHAGKCLIGPFLLLYAVGFCVIGVWGLREGRRPGNATSVRPRPSSPLRAAASVSGP